MHTTPIHSTESATEPRTCEQWLTSPTDVVTVTAWHDPVVEAAVGAIPTASDEAFIWWTPSLGSLGVAVAHRFSTYAQTGPSTWMVEDIARTFGLGESVSRVRDCLDRLERFGITRRHDRTIAVRLWLAPLSYRQRERLPQYLAQAYPW